MSIILSIETATPVCSVALHKEGKLMGVSELLLEKSHSSMLTVIIDQLLLNCGVGRSKLKAIAVSKGPGSYTGLRIGTATAKGLCFGLNIPLIGVNTLMGMADMVRPFYNDQHLFCPMIDARRMEVYCLLITGKQEVIMETVSLVVEENSFQEWFSKGQVFFFGDGSSKCRTLLTHANARFLEDIRPSASSLGNLAWGSYKEGIFEDLAYFEPFYLKEFKGIKPKIKLNF